MFYSSPRNIHFGSHDFCGGGNFLRSFPDKKFLAKIKSLTEKDQETLLKIATEKANEET